MAAWSSALARSTLAPAGQSFSPLEMRTDGERLSIEPIRSARRAKVTGAVQRATAAHDATLRKLAK